MLWHLVLRRLERCLLQPVSTARRHAALPRRRSRGSQYVCFPEPNSRSRATSDTIVIGCRSGAQAFALPDFAGFNRAHRSSITTPSRLGTACSALPMVGGTPAFAQGAE